MKPSANSRIFFTNHKGFTIILEAFHSKDPSKTRQTVKAFADIKDDDFFNFLDDSILSETLTTNNVEL